MPACLAITADDRPQQQRLGDLGAAFVRYFANLERVLAQGAAEDVDRPLALAMTADVARLSAIVTAMRDHEDGLLRQRTVRADTLLAVLLPTLSFTAAVLAFLLVFVARAINRTLRERESVLTEKDGELAAKDIMMREVDHRVRNSLNLIYTLMTFQQRRTPSDAARGLLAEAANQVLVVARVHERLYKYGSTDMVELGDYLRELCTDLATLALPVESHAAIQLQAARARVRAEQAIWLGLIVVELITNALKYGNPSLQSPVTIDVSPDEKELRHHGRRRRRRPAGGFRSQLRQGTGHAGRAAAGPPASRHPRGRPGLVRHPLHPDHAAHAGQPGVAMIRNRRTAGAEP